MNIDNSTGGALHQRAEAILAAQGKHDYDAEDYLVALAAAEAETAEVEPDPEAARTERRKLENGLAEFAWNNLTRTGVEITAGSYLAEIERLIAMVDRGTSEIRLTNIE
jgi:hypothetical protein